MVLILHGPLVRTVDDEYVVFMIDPTIFYATTFMCSLVIGLFIKSVSVFMNTVHKRDRSLPMV